MKIKMRRPHGAYKAGEIVEVSDRDAERLLAWEYATVVRDDPQKTIETASVEPVAEQAAITPRKVKRG